MKSFPAYFARGGTSNGLIIHRRDLPSRFEAWQPILAAAMGSPDDGFGRQLDGMGSGTSSTSKVCVVETSRRADADVEFTFVQVGVRDGVLDVAGNCGNMLAAVGPFALNEGLLEEEKEKEKKNSDFNYHHRYHHHHDHHHPTSPPPVHEEGSSSAAADEKAIVTVRIFNTNTSKIIHASFRATAEGVYDPCGDYTIDGVPGSGSRITLAFLDPSGAKTGKTFPTGNTIDTLRLSDGTSIAASLVDVANPGVFVLATDLGLLSSSGEDDNMVTPSALEADAALMARLEEIRQEGARRMGLDAATQTVPKVVLVSRPSASAARAGIHIVCRALSMQQAHRAVPLTLALNLGAACRMPGTLPARIAVNAEGRDSVTIAHASGTVEVGSVIEGDKVKSALLHRTARLLMKGDVFYCVRD
jgi:2-methylaconitate cis-trans-isomerase PrpF